MLCILSIDFSRVKLVLLSSATRILSGFSSCLSTMRVSASKSSAVRSYRAMSVSDVWTVHGSSTMKRLPASGLDTIWMLPSDLSTSVLTRASPMPVPSERLPSFSNLSKILDMLFCSMPMPVSVTYILIPVLVAKNPVVISPLRVNLMALSSRMESICSIFSGS